MNPRLTRGEFWLLNAVVEYCVPISWLKRGSPGGKWNLLSDHDLEREALVQTLVRMAEHGWITGHRSLSPVPGQKYEDARPLPMSREHIERALDEPDRYGERGWWRAYLELTPAGGAVWEAFASPRWERYLDECAELPEGYDEETHRSICGVSRQRIERFMRLREKHGEFIHWGSCQWDILSPWQATHWKTLPVGYRVTYLCDGERDDLLDPLARLALLEMDSIRRWYD